jgi:hypothetical protein
MGICITTNRYNVARVSGLVDTTPQTSACSVRLTPFMVQFEERKVTDYGPCECCGDLSRLASGMVRLDDEPYAIYQVHWTTQQIVRHGGEFYIILGQWGTVRRPQTNLPSRCISLLSRIGLASVWSTQTRHQGLLVHSSVVPCHGRM